jgi:hypothetical protein
MREPEGDATFLWVICRAVSPGTGVRPRTADVRMLLHFRDTCPHLSAV